MTITSKFPGRCKVCGGNIGVGEQIEWSKGEGSAHASCAKDGAAPVRAARTSAPKSPRAPSKPRAEKAEPTVLDAPYVRVERWEPCKRAQLPMVVGTTRVARGDRYCTLRAEGAKPVAAGDAFTIVAQREVWVSADAAEDTGNYNGAHWAVTLYMRPASEADGKAAREDIDRAAAAKRAAAAPKAIEAYLDREIRKGETIPELEAGAARLGPTSPGVEISLDLPKPLEVRISLMHDGTVLGWHGGYYDDYRQCAWCVRKPSTTMLLAIRALAGKDPVEMAVVADACMEAS